MPKQQQMIVEYKGHEYRQLYSGPTDYGERAKLEFMNDNTKQFWVAAETVTVLREDDSVPNDA